MKKVLALVMALVLVLSLVACGGGEKKIEEKQEELKAKIQEAAKEIEMAEPTIDPIKSAVFRGCWQWTSGEAPANGVTDFELYDSWNGKAMGDDFVYYCETEISDNEVIISDKDGKYPTLRFKYEDNTLVSVDSGKATYTNK